MNTPHIVLVEWEDITILDDGTWANTPDKHEYAHRIFRTVGYLLHDSKDGIILTGTFSPETTAPREQIPRGVIRSIEVIKKGSPFPK